MNKTVVPDEAALVFGLVVASGALEGVSLLQASTQPLPEVAISQVTKQHITAGEVAFAKRTTFAVLVRSLKGLEDGGVIAVGASGPLVEKPDHHVMLNPVMADQQFEIFGLMGTQGTLEWRRVG